MAFPVVPNLSRASKRKAIEISAIFLNFMENVHAGNRSIALLKLSGIKFPHAGYQQPGPNMLHITQMKN
jgi:hypothetical protein